MPDKLTLDIRKFSALSAERAEKGFKTYKNVPVTYWTTALAGEVGELCNMIKKMERVAHGGIDGGSSYTAASLTPEDLKEEIGDIYIYLDILSGLIGVDLSEAIIHTFNSKSDKYGVEEKYPSPSLHETEQAIDPAEARRNIPYGMDEWCEAHQSYYKYECPECASLAAPHQPVPEEVMDADKNKAFIELVRDMRPEQALRVAAYIDQEILSLRTHLSSTEAERDAIRKAFDLQAEELKKLQNGAI